MDGPDTMARDRLDDEAISAFLGREADRRVRHRAPDAEIVEAIVHRGWRSWPAPALASAMVVVVGIGLVALAVGGLPFGPAASSPPVTTGAAQLPVVASGQPCPVSESTKSTPDLPTLLGVGPVRLALADSAGSVYYESTPGGDWKAIDVLWMADPGLSGDVVVHGARLDAPGALGFGDASDPVMELRLDPRAGDGAIAGQDVLDVSPMRVRVAGCYGLVIETDGRSSVVVFEARPIGDAFAQLERPLHLPSVGARGCRATTSTESLTSRTVPFIPQTIGDGPVYLAGQGSVSVTGVEWNGGYAFLKEVWIASPSELGPILVRGGRIDTPGQLHFGDGPEPASELQLGIHSYVNTSGQPTGWRVFTSYVRPPQPGCYAMQLDTLSGSRWLVLDVVP